MDYRRKYFKYKKKYLDIKTIQGGSQQTGLLNHLAKTFTVSSAPLSKTCSLKSDATEFFMPVKQSTNPLIITSPPPIPMGLKTNDEIKKLNEKNKNLEERLTICEGEKKQLIKILAIYNVDVKKERIINDESLLPHSQFCGKSFFPHVGPFIYNEITNLKEDEINEFKNYEIEETMLEHKKNTYLTTATPHEIMLKNFIGFLNSNKGGRLFFGIGDDGRAIGIPKFRTKYIDDLQIKIQGTIFNTIMAYNIETKTKIGYVDPNKLNFVWHWVYNYESDKKNSSQNIGEEEMGEEEMGEEEEIKKKIIKLEETILPLLKVPSSPHRWILELQVTPAKTNYIYMDKNDNIWYRLSGSTVSKTLCEAEIISVQREDQVEKEIIVEIAPAQQLEHLL